MNKKGNTERLGVEQKEDSSMESFVVIHRQFCFGSKRQSGVIIVQFEFEEEYIFLDYCVYCLLKPTNSIRKFIILGTKKHS